jgi:hypothetical protein
MAWSTSVRNRAEQRLARRIVREDGRDLWAFATGLSIRGCHLECELNLGEIVSVEVDDTALFVGEVTTSIEGRSAVEFFHATSH